MRNTQKYEVKIQLNTYNSKGRTRPTVTYTVEGYNETSAECMAIDEAYNDGYDSSTYKILSVTLLDGND